MTARLSSLRSEMVTTVPQNYCGLFGRQAGRPNRVLHGVGLCSACSVPTVGVRDDVGVYKYCSTTEFRNTCVQATSHF